MPRRKLYDFGADATPVIAPDADYIFDAKEAAVWLTQAHQRKVRAYISIRLEPNGILPRNYKSILVLLYNALRLGGTLYVPSAWMRGLDIVGFRRIEEANGYIALRKTK